MIDPQSALLTALEIRPEIRRAKWNLKRIQLQVRAARSLVRPRVDLIAGYSLNAFGDKLLSSRSADGVTPNGLRSYYGTLTQNNHTGWNLGVVMSMPIGLPAERAQVAALQLETGQGPRSLKGSRTGNLHELSVALENVRLWQSIMKTNQNRVDASDRQRTAIEEQFRAKLVPVDLLLRTKAESVQALIEQRRGISEYNKALAELRYRMGELLEQNRIDVQFESNIPAQTEFFLLQQAKLLLAPIPWHQKAGYLPRNQKTSQTGRSQADSHPPCGKMKRLFRTRRESKETSTRQTPRS